jgi:photolyase PhrII
MFSFETHLTERCRWFDKRFYLSTLKTGGLILYWMRYAMRVQENPALDVAISIASFHECQLLVYQELDCRNEYSSDRHHTFVLEGAADVQNHLALKGISYAFHLSSNRDKPSPLPSLAHQAELVITEEMPTTFARKELEVLNDSTETPLMCVDASCVLPMQLSNAAFTRAFEYRKATKDEYDKRISFPWPTTQRSSHSFQIESLPFEPVNFESANFTELIATCEIDHSIPPVADTRGGSTAGYQRWASFKAKQLSQYASDRNDPLLSGVSRMSAYLHYGMVSPMRLARESAELGHAGSDKYLDELLFWRELAFVFCFHNKRHEHWDSIPSWAKKTLEAHEDDDRPIVYSWETLARAKTKDELWNAAQLTLLRHGELHNNLRMTWGKAIINWTKDPRYALELVFDLNHRYALDGRDPSSVGGILWCFGQFDRPFKPNRPILGTVRGRSTETHADRLSASDYKAQFTRPRIKNCPRIAVIGAGISGLFAARTLADQGLEVVVFEKSHGVGGRMATRRTPSQKTFDHGAQYFTARDQRFLRHVCSWQAQGVVANWPELSQGNSYQIAVLKNGTIESYSKSEQRFVGTPGMSSIGKHLANGLHVQFKTQVESITRTQNQLTLKDASQNLLGNFDRLVVSAPAAQTAELLSEFPSIREPISKIIMNPCWAVMVELSSPLDAAWAAAFVHDSPISWIARNQTKPGRESTSEHLVIHANSQWSTTNWDQDPEQVAATLLDELWQATSVASQVPITSMAHRWKYAIAANPATAESYFDAETGIAACGDWANGSRVEGAFLSGMSAAGRILGTLHTTQRIGERGSPH